MIYFDLELIFLDYVVLVFTAIIIIFSFWKGFINSILGLLTWVGSIFITIYTYQYLTEFIDNLLLSIRFFQNFEQFISIISIILSIPIIFLISIFILRKIRKFLSSDLDKQILGIIFDKIFGIIYGIIFAYLIFSSVIYLSDNYNIVLDSNILNKISEYNYNIIEIYTGNK